MKNEFELKDFSRNPELRKLLVNFCLTMYEENAIIDDEHLIMEYNWLNANNKLNDLYYAEFISNCEDDAVSALRYS